MTSASITPHGNETIEPTGNAFAPTTATGVCFRQGGASYLFRHEPHFKSQHNHSTRERVLQSDFRTCENFCHGLQEAGARVHVAWCNEAGDIVRSFWRFTDFDRAPFCEWFWWPEARAMVKAASGWTEVEA